jgi:hypothetical protein
MRNRIRAGRQRIRMALGAGQITAIVPGSNDHITIPFTSSAELDSTDALCAALEQVRLQVSAASGLSLDRVDLDLVLLPPLIEARLIPLPPLRKSEAELVIRRDAARHFVGGNGPRAFAIRLATGARPGSAPVLAVAASALLIEQLRRAAATLGWRVRAIVPALASWLALAERAGARTPFVIVAEVGDTFQIIRGQGAPQQLRRVPRSSPAELWESIGAGPGRAFVLASAQDRPALERGLAAAGWQVERQSGHDADAAVVAARCAQRNDLELVPNSAVLERQQNQQRLALRLALAAFVLMASALVLELWGARRELGQLRAQRAAIREQVAPLLATRDSVDLLDQRSARVLGLESSAPQWTSALFDLAMLLPADTHLRSLSAQGDTLVIEATGDRAGEAIQALRSATTLRDVRLKGQVERELEDGATSLERFTVQARLVPRDSISRAAPQPRESSVRPGRSQ